MLKTKKIFSLIIAVMMIVSTGIYASAGKFQRNANTATTTASSVETSNAATDTASSTANRNKNSAEYKAAKAKFAEYKIEFIRNQNEIQSLREQIKACMTEISGTLSNIDADKVTSQQMLQYQEMVKALKEVRGEIKAEHKGQIQTQIQNMKQSRQNGNYGKATLAFEKIIKEQEARIVMLKGILTKLQPLTVKE